MDLQKNKISNKTYNIITYNIAGNKPTYNLYNIVNILKQLDVDVICLQEVFLDIQFANQMRLEPNRATQAHAIAHYLNYPFCIFGQTLKDKCYGIAIISRLPIINSERVELPNGSLTRTIKNKLTRMPGAKEPRLALCATISPNSPNSNSNANDNLIIICTHFGLYNDTDIDIEIAKIPISIINNYISDPKFAGLPCILAGDLNFKPDNIMRMWLAEEWIVPIKNTNTYFDKEIENIGKEIDYIAIRPNNKFVILNQSVVINDLTLITSDHLPLIATISML
jgi:endonuclease/exonuclease/phosphatase family metal-dependent hydrolase